MPNHQQHNSPPPRRRSSDIVKRDLHRRLRGKPTHSPALLSIPRTVGMALQRVITLAIVILIIAGFTLAGLGGGMLLGYVTTAGNLNFSQFKNKNETTKILDAQGNEIAILTGSQNINRQNISFSTVKATYIDEAFIAVEDERFREHPGIDARRIGSAVLSALVNGGSATHGGSTITQQTVRLMTGADMRSAQRKVQEWYKAIQLEQQKSKDEIMELYINLVPMGNSYVGLQSAAQGYFDKNASELNLVECAFLAGIPNAPSIYNPKTETGLRNALRRMRIVLSLMHDQGMISEKQYEEALNTELIFRQTPQTLTGTQINSYFVDYVIEEVIDALIEKRGYSEPMASIAVYNYGFTIKTTMDSRVQSAIEQTFRTENLFITKPDQVADLPEAPNGSMVVISNMENPGQIKGMVGGYGEKTGNFILNRAVSALRQPGSSIKPLDVYGPAIDTGIISPATVFTDMILYYNKDEPEVIYPRNSPDKFEGNMNVRMALTKSKNTIAAQIWRNYLGGTTSLQYLKQVGIDRTGENYVSIALGGFNKGMTTLEMAGAYATFANAGLYTEPYCFTQVIDGDGNVLLDNTPVEPVEVYKPETAYVMLNMMHDVVVSPSGTANRVLKTDIVNGIYTAGKTGTTDENRDKWFCGFTPYYTATVWYGYDNRLGVQTILDGDKDNALRIWKDAMARIHEGLQPAAFNKPSGVQMLTICIDSSMLANEFCVTSATEFFVPGAQMNPSEKCTLHAAPTPTPTPPVVEPVETTNPAGNVPPGQNGG
ncbi:MAG TPA: penicillin-binding protein [Clostridiales bacterium]|nr:penicillin-binding protein [Clostridiales bacterium]